MSFPFPRKADERVPLTGRDFGRVEAAVSITARTPGVARSITDPDRIARTAGTDAPLIR